MVEASCKLADSEGCLSLGFTVDKLGDLEIPHDNLGSKTVTHDDDSMTKPKVTQNA